MKGIRTILVWLLCAGFACNLPEYYLDRDREEWALPLLNGEIKAMTLLENSVTLGEIRVSQDGTLAIHYTGEILQKTKKDIFQPLPGNLPIPMTDTLNEVTLPVVNNMIIRRAVLGKGNYSFAFGHQETEPVSLQLWIPEMVYQGQTVQHKLEIPYAGETNTSGISGPHPLEDIRLIPVNNKVGLHYRALASGNRPFLLPSLFFYYDQLDFKYVEGFIGQNIYDLKSDTIELDLYDGFVQGGLYIDEPRVTMQVVSSFGFPTKALVHTFEMRSGQGAPVSFQSKILDEGMFFDYPALGQAGQFKTTTFVFDPSNSNIREVFNAQARFLIYDVDALSNPLLVPDSSYFITDSSRFTIHVSVDLPLRGRIRQYPASKIFNLDGGQLSELKEGRLVVQTENGLPLSASAQIYLNDLSGMLIDSVFTGYKDLFKPAPTDSEGKAAGTASYQYEIPVPAARIGAWTKTRSVRVEVFFDSPPGGQVVGIRAEDKLNIKLGFIGKIK
ncbi:MAG TPA: hypothetical protein PKL70_11340 [Saprospiraceae bacterium]|nr:hypothetical protein [Saprospiraceae bacterium]